MDSCKSAAIHAARRSFRATMKNFRVYLQLFSSLAKGMDEKETNQDNSLFYLQYL
jgi:hypothetical protein